MKQITKKLLALLLSLVMLITALPITGIMAFAVTSGDFLTQNIYSVKDNSGSGNVKFAGGDGSVENPYVINTVKQLAAVNNNLSGSYILGSNIDLTSVASWTPIGTESEPFTGSFNGNGHIISNITINARYDSNNLSTNSVDVGLFGYTNGATIVNLGIENANYVVTSGDFSSQHYSNVGGIAGTIKNTSIDSSYFEGTISNNVSKNIFSRAAGIAAIGSSSTVTNCYSISDIYANAYNMNTMAAGLVAWLDSVTINKCYVAGSVVGENTTGYSYVGGANASGNASSMYGYIISYGGTVKNSVFMLDVLTANGTTNYKDNMGNFSDKSNNKVISSTSDAAKKQVTYENLGWDFTNVWECSESLPILLIFKTKNNEEHPVYPSGYDFFEDSYDFANYGESISKKYYTTIYEDGPGTLLYKANKNVSKGGLCFGMAYTTAAIYNGMPDCSIISTLDDGIFEYKYCDNIREIVNCNLSFPFSDICSAFTIGDNTISVEDYIKYAFIYQMSSEVAKSSSDTWGDVQGLYNTVKAFTDNNIIGVTIGMTHYEMDANGNPQTDSEGNYITSGHRVLAVGYEGRDILIDDPNNTDSLERLTINDDWSWSYSGGWTSDGVNSENSITRYQTDIHRPYQILLTGNATTTNNNSDSDNIETYIEGIEELDLDSLLVYIDSDKEIQLPANAVQVFNCDGTISNNLNNSTMYWLQDTDEIEVSNIYGSISFAGDEKILSVSADSISNLSGCINDSSFGVDFKSNKGEQCSLEYCSILEDEEITLVVSGTIAKGTVSVQKTIEGIQIDGLSKGTVTLINNGSEIEKVDFDDCDNSFEISDDNNEILLQSNDSGHNYSVIQYDDNGHWYKCSNCDATSDKVSHCNGYATCQIKAICDVCGVIYGDFADHDYANTWSKDQTGHWYACQTAGCTQKSQFAAHTPDHIGNATEEYAIKCSACGYIIEQQLAHIHDFTEEVATDFYKASNADCTTAATYYKSCRCGEKSIETFFVGEALGHNFGEYTVTKEPTIMEKGEKASVCTVCGEKSIIEIPAIEYKLGDVNGDDKITIIDAKWILQSIAGTKSLTDAQKAAADLNNDGKITIIDAKWVLQIVAGTRDSKTL